MEYTIRPLGPWLDPMTSSRRGAHIFRASWADTLKLLGRELDYLDATQVVFQIDVQSGDVRRDGMLRVGAKVGFPGVRVAFQSRYGPLTYATDAYEQQYSGDRLSGWQANIRAIALGLESLRAVDRYGITRRGEQYQGWTAISNRPAEMAPEQAAEFIAHWADEPARFTADSVLKDPDLLDRALKVAARRVHPNLPGGDHDTMARLNAARDVLRRQQAGR